MMIRIVYSLTFLLLFLAGVIIAIVSIVDSKKIFSGEVTKFTAVLMNSTLTGLSVSLLFFGAIFFISAVSNNSYYLQIKDLFLGFGISAVPGLIVLIGSLWQYLQIKIFREGIKKIIGKRKK